MNKYSAEGLGISHNFEDLASRLISAMKNATRLDVGKAVVTLTDKIYCRGYLYPYKLLRVTLHDKWYRRILGKTIFKYKISNFWFISGHEINISYWNLLNDIPQLLVNAYKMEEDEQLIDIEASRKCVIDTMSKSKGTDDI